MATIDKKGDIHGSVGPNVYRMWRDIKVIQSKPKRNAKRTIASKEASLEFGMCSSTARVIRTAFGWAYKAYDGGMINRFTKAVRSAVSASSKEVGERDIHDADLSFLKGFQFNNNSPLDKVLKLRPTAELSEDNKVIVNLPRIAKEDIKAHYAQEYGIRLLVIAFDFKERVYSNIAAKEIRINYKQAFEGGAIVFDEPLPEGRLVAVSMSIYGYKPGFGGGVETTNNVQWSPGEILNLWQLPAQAEDKSHAVLKMGPFRYENIPMGYQGDSCLARIAWLRRKAEETKISSSKPAEKHVSVPPDFPKGDVKF
ncbi:hypothetical protein [Desertivirga arenae]|uniref:hypothetical protein n=1 Tax=Desertivirga arenae TaxID=2810309 RepID=UPI001A97C4B9|nr:hypothetical protein [Pedobacter sp. SYSU D00823]